MPTIPKPRFVNRGAAGLLRKASVPSVLTAPPKPGPVAKYRIAPGLDALVVPIDTLVQDPMNARNHPEANILALKASLTEFGQTKPVVVRRQTMVIVAGNGTHRCAKELGWTDIAASVVDMTDAEAAAYGVADNRTAELATWNLDILTTLEKVISADGRTMTGYTIDELQALRAREAGWVPPAVNGGDSETFHTIKLVLTDEQKNIVEVVTGMLQERTRNKKLTESEAVTLALEEWLPKPSYEITDAGENDT